MAYLDETGLERVWNKIKALISGKQDALVSGTNIKTINNQSLLGSGNINVGGGGGSTNWDDIQNKPDTFPPEAHTHTTADITDAISGEVITATHDTASTLSKETWTKKVNSEITLEPGTWIIHGYGYFKSKSTGTGSTDSSAGYRNIRIGYKQDGGESSLSGSISKGYAGAGQTAYLHTSAIRQYTKQTKLWIDAYSSTQVGLDNVRIEAVRVK